MSDTSVAIVVAIVFLIFGGVGIVLLLWPSKFLRRVRNPLQPDTPINRASARAVGVVICLFVLVAVSGPFEGFHRNALVALAISPVILPIFLWILWRYSSLQRVNRRYLAGDKEEPQWEVRMKHRVRFTALHNCSGCVSFGGEGHLPQVIRVAR